MKNEAKNTKANQQTREVQAATGEAGAVSNENDSNVVLNEAKEGQEQDETVKGNAGGRGNRGDSARGQAERAFAQGESDVIIRVQGFRSTIVVNQALTEEQANELRQVVSDHLSKGE